MNKADRIRAFIAVPVSAEVRRAVSDLQSTLRRRGVALRWVSPENVHFTLKFLGGIDPAIVPPLSEVLQTLAKGVEAFDVRLGGLGAFPNLGAPRVFWAGVVNGAERLKTLASEVSTVVKDFPTEADNKPFKPHLTLGRSKSRRSERLVIPPNLLQGTLGDFRCDRMVLMKSVLGPGGAQYTPLCEARLV